MHLLRHLLHVPHFYRLFLTLCLFIAAASLWYLLRRYFRARRHRPTIAKSNILYQESFASGNSQKNLLTQIGGAHNCLRIIVTKDLLVLTSWFPFSLLTPFYDLEHAIPIGRILALDSLKSFDRTGFLLVYGDSGGVKHAIHLFPKSREAFQKALGATCGHPLFAR